MPGIHGCKLGSTCFNADVLLRSAQPCRQILTDRKVKVDGSSLCQPVLKQLTLCRGKVETLVGMPHTVVECELVVAHLSGLDLSQWRQLRKNYAVPHA